MVGMQIGSSLMTTLRIKKGFKGNINIGWWYSHMPVRYIHMPVFGAYTCPQTRLSACLNRLFSMFADGRELQKSIASCPRAQPQTPRGYINLARSFTQGTSSKAWARKRTCGRTRRTRRIISTTVTARASTDCIYCFTATLCPCAV